MFKKIIPFLALLVLLTSIFVLSYQVKLAGAAIIYVPDNYTTIQSAINHAGWGDTIIVRDNRTYNEDVFVNKSVTLRGEDKYTTVIRGVANSSTTAQVVYVTASNASVTGFTIKDANPEHDKAGIVLSGVVNCNVSGNILPEDIFPGISLLGSRYSVIAANTFTGSGLGVAYTSYSNLIVNNTVNGKSIVYLENAANLVVSGTGIGQVILVRSRNITVVNTNLSHTSLAVQVRSSNGNKIIGNTWTSCYEGISVSNSSNNQISENKAINGTFSVVLLNRADNNTVSGNNIIASDFDGVYLGYHCDFNNISGNNITASFYNGVEIRGGLNNMIHHNNFINNTTPAFVNPVNATNTWDNGYPSGGNYWSNSNRTDTHKGPYQNQTGSDGISDIQYVLNSFNKDRYPLMGPVGPSIVATGANVTAFPTPDAALTFNQVTASGAVTGIASPTGPPPPTGYILLGQYYDIKVAATYSGNITVRIIYDDSGMTPEKEANLKMGQIDLIPGDTNKDGKVNLIDVFAVALAFGSYPGHSRWNPACDINGDGKVDLKDYFTTAKNFNKVAQWKIVTTYVDTANNLIYGETSHFSLIGIHTGA